MHATMSLKMVVVTLRCAEPARLGKFYSEVLRLPLLRSDQEYAVLDCGGVSLELIRDSGHEKQDLQFESGDIDGLVNRLKSSNVTFEEIETGLRPDGTMATSSVAETFWGRYAILRDPEGNRVTLADHDEQFFPFLPSWYSPVAEKERQTNG